jgi:hypothetical protein
MNWNKKISVPSEITLPNFKRIAAKVKKAFEKPPKYEGLQPAEVDFKPPRPPIMPIGQPKAGQRIPIHHSGFFKQGGNINMAVTGYMPSPSPRQRKFYVIDEGKNKVRVYEPPPPWDLDEPPKIPARHGDTKEIIEDYFDGMIKSYQEWLDGVSKIAPEGAAKELDKLREINIVQLYEGDISILAPQFPDVKFR